MDRGAARFLVKSVAVALAALFVGGAALRAIHNDYAFFLAYLVLQYVALALGWNVLGGYAGFVNFGAAAFFAAGAYATVAIHKAVEAPLPACVLLGGASGAALGLVMGALTLRLRGVYFAISTLSLSVMLETLIINSPYVGGSAGAYLIRPKSFAPFVSYTEYLCLWMFFIAAGAAIGSAWIERAAMGAGLAAIRDDEVAAAALGVPTLRLKVTAAAISGAILGAAGAPLPFYNSYVNPETAFGIGYSVNALAMSLVGGVETWLGPVVGAVALSLLQQFALAFISSSASLAIVGLVFMAFVIFAPRGLVGLYRFWRGVG
jgi:branched-chain amino acid transport system permease protein